jgi:hypothetical protein
MRPTFGEAQPPPAGQCSYETGDGRTCRQPARWHGITLQGDEPEALESCDAGPHLTAMADITEFMHPWNEACADENSGFDPDANRCVVMD